MDNMNEQVKAMDTLTDVAEVVSETNSGNGAATALVLAGVATAGALLWQFAIKPAGKAIGGFIKKKQDERNKAKYDKAVPKKEPNVVDADEESEDR